MYFFRSLSLNDNFETGGLDLTYPEQGLGDTASAYYMIPGLFVLAGPKPVGPLFAVITGTSGNDTLNGTANSDTIDGLAGDDVINGLGGNDDINAGSGADIVDAGDGDDIITDTEFAAPGDSDFYDGGAGNDTLVYTALLGGSEITFNLATGEQTLLGGSLLRDTFANIENLTLAGTVNAIGDANSNILTATGSAVNIFEGGGGADTLDGGAGSDTLSYAGSSAGVTINLATGTAAGGDANGDVFFNFENILGSAFADSLTGDANNNTIDGGAGNDSISGGGGTETLIGGDGSDIIFSSGIGSQSSSLSGGAGNDTLFVGGDMLNGDSADGGDGFDTISFQTFYTASYSIDGGADGDLISASNQTAALEIDLAAGRMNFVGSTDSFSESTVSNIENIHGGAGNDILTGDANDNRIEGDQGDDLIDGGTGNDTAVYINAVSAVTVSLVALGSAQNTGGAGTDMLFGIENLTGSGFNDTLIGDVFDNVLQGYLGDDTLRGGQGNDILQGDQGSDTADFTLATSSVTIDLNIQGVAQNSWGTDMDTLISIENITGSVHHDNITGDAGDNVLSGAGGDDLIEGGAGADIIDGGSGIDTLSYAGSSEAVFLGLGGVGFNGDAEGDVVSNVENIIGSAFNDNLIGDANENVLDGGDGNDSLGGADGNDTLNGEDGDDFLRGDLGADILNGGIGSDILEGGDGNDILNGGVGDDTLEGGLGVDTLTGGAGCDAFFFDMYADSGVGMNADIITDFALGDVIRVSEYLGVSRDAYIGEILNFLGTSAFTSSGNPELRYETNSGQTLIQMDSNGDGIADSEIIIQSGEFDLRLTNDGVPRLEVDSALTVTSPNGDKVIGTNGNDVLVGSAEADSLRGLAGDDTIDAGAGDDFISGGSGNDIVDGGDGVDQITYFGDAPVDLTITDSSVFDAVSGETDTLSNIERITHSQRLAAPSDDTMDASAATVFVGLYGGRGNDVLIGGSNDDIIEGDIGTDTLTGGLGADRFMFDFAEEIQNDVITDFEVGDTIEFTLIEFVELVDLTWLDTAAFTGLAGEFRSDASGGQTVFEFDLNGDMVADRFITLLGGEFTFFDTEPGLHRYSILTGAPTAGDDTIIGTNGDDVLDGLAGNDTIQGLAGDDIISGGEGGDYMDGGEGDDTLSYAGSDSFVTADLAANVFLGGDASGDSVVNFENLLGSDFDDELFGDAGNNIIEGGAGADQMSGGAGVDTLNYAGSSAGVSINLETGTLSGGDAAGDTASNFENLQGSEFADILTGDALDNVLSGLGGNDILDGGAGNDALNGNDGDDVFIAGLGHNVVDGGAGMDILSFVNATSAFSLFTLDDGTIIDVSAQGLGIETITSIEGVIGSDFDDFISFSTNSTDMRSQYFDGGAGDDFIRSGNGDDEIHGGDGDDNLRGNGGDDTLFGGNGDDFMRSDAGVDIFDGGAGFDRISFLNLNATQGATADLRTGIVSNDGFGNMETFASIEGLGGGTAYVDLFDGDNNDNVLLATGFGDTINAYAGDDTVQVDSGGAYDGGAGTDYFIIIGGDRLIIDTDSDGFAEFESQTLGVNVDLQSGIISEDGFGGTGTAINFENLYGGGLNDTLYGTSGANEIAGRQGNDFIDGREGDDSLTGGLGDDILIGGVGADIIDGGAGIDLASYTVSSAGVSINLAAGTASGGDAAGDVLTGIEDLAGSAFNDTLTGDLNVNNIFGEAGDDIIQTGAGIDSVEAGAGNDTIIWNGANGDFEAGETYDGGDGNDTIVVTGSAFSGGWNPIPGAIFINLASGEIRDVTDTMVLATAINFENYDGSASSSGVEAIIGTAEGNVITTAAFSQAFIFGLGGNDTLTTGIGNDQVTGGEGADIMDGGAGIDLLSYDNGVSTASTGVTVNLATGMASGGDAQGDVFSNFENLRGSDFADNLTGDANANVIEGGDGDDILNGGAGDDTLIGGVGGDILIGGAGADTLDGGDNEDQVNYLASSAGVTIDLVAGTGFGGDAEGDVLSSIEGISGSNFDDILTGNDVFNNILGNAGDDIINGGAGDDLIQGGAGADTMDGGTGIDTLNYSESSSGVNVNLATGFGSGGDATGDVFSNFENLTGSFFANDVLTGDANNNIIDGNAGNDRLDGGAGDDILIGGEGADTLIGGAGADSHDGGLGFDTVDYRGATSRVVLNATDTGTVGDAAGDTYTSIERFYGSNFNDIMTGTDANEFFYGEDGNDQINAGGGIDRLYGGDGNDVMRGDAGNDQLYGSAGNDQLNGGTGFDIANYSFANSAVTVNLASGGTVGDAAGDTYFGVEAVYGSDFDDSLTGNNSSNELRGGEGDDILNGGLGGDRLFGEEGADAFDGGGGIDRVYYTTASSGVTLSLITGGTAGDAAGDSFVSVEWVFGSDFDDTITGDTANNRLSGGEGNDVLDGGAGNDRLLGGDGNDTLLGGEGVDTIFGQAGDDTMFGGDSNDFFFGGAGADSHDGGAGLDTVSYLGSDAGVIVNMQTGGTGGDAAGDSYVNIERVFGSGYDDALVGSNGDDNLQGNGGADYLAGGLGSDSLSGGAGVDSFGYDTTQDGADVINGFTTNEVIFILGSDPNFDSFAEVQAAGTDAGANVVFNFGGGNTLVILGQNLADLNASNFDFTLASEGLTDKEVDAFASEARQDFINVQDDAMAMFDMDALI